MFNHKKVLEHYVVQALSQKAVVDEEENKQQAMASNLRLSLKHLIAARVQQLTLPWKLTAEVSGGHPDHPARLGCRNPHCIALRVYSMGKRCLRQQHLLAILLDASYQEDVRETVRLKSGLPDGSRCAGKANIKRLPAQYYISFSDARV